MKGKLEEIIQLLQQESSIEEQQTVLSQAQEYQRRLMQKKFTPSCHLYACVALALEKIGEINVNSLSKMAGMETKQFIQSLNQIRQRLELPPPPVNFETLSVAFGSTFMVPYCQKLYEACSGKVNASQENTLKLVIFWMTAKQLGMRVGQDDLIQKYAVLKRDFTKMKDRLEKQKSIETILKQFEEKKKVKKRPLEEQTAEQKQETPAKQVKTMKQMQSKIMDGTDAMIELGSWQHSKQYQKYLIWKKQFSAPALTKEQQLILKHPSVPIYQILKHK